VADTWRSISQGTQFLGSAVTMMDVFQTGAGSRVYRIRRISLFNNQSVAVTGLLVTLQLQRITAVGGGGTLLTPVALDTSSSALPGDVDSRSGRTGTLAAVLRQVIWSSDEPSVGTAPTSDEWEMFVPFSEIWNAGFADTAVQPLTARPGEGYCLRQSASGSTQAGLADVEFEFTNEAS
jgi:hypothetical protein